MTSTRDVIREAANLYDEPRELHLHEQVFLSAVHEIGKRFSAHRGSAARQYGWQSEAHLAVVSMADRQEESELVRALQSFHNERDRFNGDYDDRFVEEFLIAAE